MFESIIKIKLIFRSIRYIEDKISLDLFLPISLMYLDIIKKYSDLNVITQDKNNNLILISLIGSSTQESFDLLFDCAFEIMKFNQDEEEKQRLFKQKVDELKILFKNESLSKLQEINLLNYGQTNTTRDGMAIEGDKKRSKTD